MTKQPMTRDRRIDQGAMWLRGAEDDRRPIEPLTETLPGLTVDEAYRIQLSNVAEREARGDEVVGYKIGLTARTMQELFSVDEPDYGHLLRSMIHDGAEPLDLGPLIEPQIEVEPAFVLGRSLAGPGVTMADVMAATEYVVTCFEVIDSRINNWRIRLEDTVADNGSSARVVLGEERKPVTALADEGLETVLELDGSVVETGNTEAILGHPANGVVWLVNALADYGVTLSAGHLVLPGTCTRSVRIAGCRKVRGRIEGLGDVTLSLVNEPAVPARK